MNQREQELLDKQLWGCSSRPPPNEVGLVVVAVFLVGMAVGAILFTHDSELKQIASHEAGTACFPFKWPAADHALSKLCGLNGLNGICAPSRGKPETGPPESLASCRSPQPDQNQPPHSLILDDCTSFSNAIRPSMCANSDVSNESVDVWTGLPFAVMTQR